MRRRTLLLFLPIIALAGGSSAWATDHAREGRGIAFIVNSAGASISVVDMSTLKAVRRIPTLREPHHLALSPDGKFLTVNGLARNQVDVYDAATMKLVKRFPVVATPSHLAYSPDSSTVFVTLQDSDKLAAFDLRSMTVKWTMPVGRTPAGVLWLNGRVLVADMGTDYIAVVDPATGNVEEHIRTGKGAHQLFLSPDRRILWVNNRAGGTTVSLDATTLKLIRSYSIPGGPDDMAFAPDGRIWITRRWAEKVAVLDPATGSYQTIEVGRSPHGLFLNPSAPSPTLLSSR
jgi:DNA-binding beta-propeller fold protein YncE